MKESKNSSTFILGCIAVLIASYWIGLGIRSVRFRAAASQADKDQDVAAPSETAAGNNAAVESQGTAVERTRQDSGDAGDALEVNDNFVQTDNRINTNEQMGQGFTEEDMAQFRDRFGGMTEEEMSQMGGRGGRGGMGGRGGRGGGGRGGMGGRGGFGGGDFGGGDFGGDNLGGGEDVDDEQNNQITF